MSAAEEAVAALSAVVQDVETACGRMPSAAGAAGEARQTLSAVFVGSSHPGADAALRLLEEATDAVAAAERLLTACAEDVRAYLAEASGTSSPVPAALGGGTFRPGVYDPEGLFSPKERRIADRLAEAGASVHPRRADHTKHGRSNPDAVVRWSSTDPGTITEFKTLDPGEDAWDTTLRAAIGRGSKQLRATGGCLVIDTRGTALTEARARRGHARAVGNARVHGKTLPRRIIVILPSDAMIDLSRGE